MQSTSANASNHTPRGNTMDVSTVQALTFDVFGTVVDWRGSLIRQGVAFGAARGLSVDWARFADDWRGGDGPSMDRVRRGALPWTNIDTLHRLVLDQLLEKNHNNDLKHTYHEHLR